MNGRDHLPSHSILAPRVDADTKARADRGLIVLVLVVLTFIVCTPFLVAHIVLSLI